MILKRQHLVAKSSKRKKIIIDLMVSMVLLIIGGFFGYRSIVHQSTELLKLDELVELKTYKNGETGWLKGEVKLTNQEKFTGYSTKTEGDTLYLMLWKNYSWRQSDYNTQIDVPLSNVDFNTIKHVYAVYDAHPYIENNETSVRF